jgi:hypothetical protein
MRSIPDQGTERLRWGGLEKKDTSALVACTNARIGGPPPKKASIVMSVHSRYRRAWCAVPQRIRCWKWGNHHTIAADIGTMRVHTYILPIWPLPEVEAREIRREANVRLRSQLNVRNAKNDRTANDFSRCWASCMRSLTNDSHGVSFWEATL